MGERTGRHLPDMEEDRDSHAGSSTMYASYDGYGSCCCDNSGTGLTLPFLITALGAATFFLFTVIQMAGRRRRRKRRLGENDEGGEGVLEEFAGILWDGEASVCGNLIWDEAKELINLLFCLVIH